MWEDGDLRSVRMLFTDSLSQTPELFTVDSEEAYVLCVGALDDATNEYTVQQGVAESYEDVAGHEYLGTSRTAARLVWQSSGINLHGQRQLNSDKVIALLELDQAVEGIKLLGWASV